MHTNTFVVKNWVSSDSILLSPIDLPRTLYAKHFILAIFPCLSSPSHGSLPTRAGTFITRVGVFLVLPGRSADVVI